MLFKKLTPLILAALLITGCGDTESSSSSGPDTSSPTSQTSDSSSSSQPSSTVTGVYLNKSSANLLPGSSLVLTASVFGADNPSQEVTWSSSNTEIAIVSNGNVTISPVAPIGQTATIRATSVVDTTKYGECVITIVSSVPTVTSVTLNKYSASVTQSGSLVLTATVNGTDSPSQEVTWTSSNEDYATVSGGNVSVTSTATIGQTVNIRATSVADTSKYAECVITISGPAPSGEVYLQKFNELKTSITNVHNYTIDVHSYIVGHEEDPDTVYDDQFVNINDHVYYNNYYSGVSGKILQKNQGYINFIYAGSSVIENGFYATNYNTGISTLYDIVGENIFIGDYTQGISDQSLFTTDNFDSIAVAFNFSGYSESAWASAPEELIIKVLPDSNELVVTLNFVVHYYDGGAHADQAITTLRFNKIGTSHHTVLEDYVVNPTNVFVDRTSWNEDDNELFGALFAGTIPPFPTGASFAFSLEEYNDFGTYKAMLTDYGCGNRLSSYGQQLVDSLGFTKVDNNNYTLTTNDAVHMTKTDYTVQMVYGAPSEPYRLSTVGHYFPAGIFQILFKGKTTNINIDTVEKLNNYMNVNGADEAVPLLPFDDDIAVSKFQDETATMNGDYPGRYIFYTSTSHMRIHIADYSDALAAYNSYVTLLQAAKYTEKQVSPFGTVTYTNKTDFKNDSYVSMTNMEAVTSSSYAGFIELRFQIYAFKDESDIPVLSYIEVNNPKTEFNQGDDFVFGGTVRAHYSDGSSVPDVSADVVFTGYNMSVSGTQTVTASYTEGGVTKTKTYEIHVASTLNIYTETFNMYGDTFTLTINLCDDGTGRYSLRRVHTGSDAYDKTSLLNFTYVTSGNKITFTFVSSEDLSGFTRYCLFATDKSWIREGTIEGNQITVELSTQYGTNNADHTFTKS